MRRPRVRRCQPWPLLGGRKYLEVEPFSTLAPPHNQAEVRKMKRAMTSISYMMELEADGKVIIPGRLQKPITKGLAFVPVADSILGVPSDTGIQLDDKGRVILHKELRNAFGINNKVVVVRGFGCIQIWGSEGFHKLICSQDAWFQKAPLEYLP
jgi:DNA-binding transcriptional regulator/RsmH inhibitor MraZ